MCTALKDKVLNARVSLECNFLMVQDPERRKNDNTVGGDVDAGQRSPVTIQTEIVGCQGLTVQKLSLDLRRPVFSHGQLYSAITRVPDADNVLILKYEDDSSQRITNIVWEELLLQLQCTDINANYLTSARLKEGITTRSAGLPREGDKWSL
ncbi:hypothetical protein B0H13DRAFT_1852351 [Mycena leptocephala]|nr:hypothetical protein B0H13DRAFT_1852351 [Mycena leptocephala]